MSRFLPVIHALKNSFLNSGRIHTFSAAHPEIISAKGSTLKSVCPFRQVTGITFSNKASPLYVGTLYLSAGLPGGLLLLSFFQEDRDRYPPNDARALINFSY